MALSHSMSWMAKGFPRVTQRLHQFQRIRAEDEALEREGLPGTAGAEQECLS